MTEPASLPIDLGELRAAIREEYEAVASDPGRGYHFHTGRPLAVLLGYEEEWLDGVPEGSIESFAGTGNPFRLGALAPGERVVYFGSGAGMVALRRLDEAVADGDLILGVIKGSGVNNDGANKVSYLAPSVDGQAGALDGGRGLAHGRKRRRVFEKSVQRRPGRRIAKTTRSDRAETKSSRPKCTALKTRNVAVSFAAGTRTAASSSRTLSAKTAIHEPTSEGQTAGATIPKRRRTGPAPARCADSSSRASTDRTAAAQTRIATARKRPANSSETSVPVS